MGEINYFNKNSLPEDLMSDLVQAIMDEINQKNKDIVEPYEFYANKLHLKLFEQPDSISERLAKGYQSLLTELSDVSKPNEDKI